LKTLTVKVSYLVNIKGKIRTSVFIGLSPLSCVSGFQTIGKISANGRARRTKNNLQKKKRQRTMLKNSV